MQVLIADDDPVYLSLLEDLMGQWGYEVQAVPDGNRAWEVLTGPGAPRLILLDWMMPGLDGFELCRRIRQAAGLEEAYVILITGSRGEKDIMRVLVAGADDYLIKPFEPSDLKVRIRAAIRILDLREEISELKRQIQGGQEEQP